MGVSNAVKQGIRVRSVQQPLSMEAPLSPLSLREQPACPGEPWRDLQFRGPFLEMFFDRPYPNLSFRAVFQVP